MFSKFVHSLLIFFIFQCKNNESCGNQFDHSIIGFFCIINSLYFIAIQRANCGIQKVILTQKKTE